MRLSCVVQVSFILLLGSFVFSTRSSRIKFEDGLYNEILVAISPSLQLNSSTCIQIEQSIEELFRSSSDVLKSSTLGESSIGTVNILIPSDSTLECGNHFDAKIYEIYENADIKITNEHPMASELPWTKQHGSCEEVAESIYIPTNFFQFFTSREKSLIFTHEWAKFRYGVFEEFGYYEDPLYSSCHAFNGLYYLTSNSDADLTLNYTHHYNPPILPETCKNLIEENVDLQDRINSELASLMFSPLSTRILNLLENGEKRQGISPTKQNIQCNRRSVRDVILSHPDFSVFGPIHNIKKRSISNVQPTFNIIRAKQNFDGFLFIMETPGNTHNLNHMKQAIGQMVYLIPFVPQTRVRLVTYDVNANELNWRNTIILNSINNKKNFMNSFDSANEISNKTSIFANNISSVISEVLNKIKLEEPFVNWHMVLIPSSPPVGVSRAVEEMKTSENEISIFTFDPSKYWLQWNKNPNTKQMIYIPTCFQTSYPCTTFSSSFTTDHFLTLIQNNSEKKHIKVMEVKIDSSRAFQLETLGENEKYTFVLPVFSSLAQDLKFNLSNEGITCELVQEYPNVFVSNGDDCLIKGGVVNYDYGHLLVNTHYLNVYKEKNSNDVINVRQFFNHDLSNEIRPHLKQLAAYVSLSTKDEKPILGSFVSINEIIETSRSLEKVNHILRDDGISPDLTSGDGIYSTFLYNLPSSSPSPTFTISQLEIITENSNTLQSISPPLPALLNSKLSSKCCGSIVKPETSSNTPKETFFFTLPALRFIQSSTPSMILPQIEHLNLISESPQAFLIQFVQSVYTVPVDFDLCCTGTSTGIVNNDLCTQMPHCEKELNQEGQEITKCEMTKSSAAFDRKYDTGKPNETSNGITYIYCGVRSRNGTFVSELSKNFIEIQMDESFFHVETVTSGCDSVDDNCLPIDVFWGLIACIGGIFGILLIVLFCWFLTIKREKAEKRSAKKMSESEAEEIWLNKNKLETTQRRPSVEMEGKSLGNVFINQAYIQDTNGDLKLIASNGQIIGDDEEIEREVAAAESRRLGNPIPLPSIRKNSRMLENDHEDENMMVFKSGTKRESGKREYSTMAEPPPSFLFDSRETPKPKDRPSIKTISNQTNSLDDVGYQNHHNHFMLAPFNQVKKPKRRDSDELSPIYASVNRNGRRNLGNKGQKRYNTSSGFPAHEFAFLQEHEGNLNRDKKFKFNESNGDFSSYNTGMSSGRGSIFTSEPSPPLPPPLPNKNGNFNNGNFHNQMSYRHSSSRLDHFPSSESDSLNSEKIEDSNKNKVKSKEGKAEKSGGFIPKPPPMPPSPKSGSKSYNSSNNNTWNSRPKLSKSSSINSDFSSVSKVSHANTDRESVISELNSFFKRAPPPAKNNPDVVNNERTKPELPPKRVTLKHSRPPPVPPPRPPKGTLSLPMADEEDFDDDSDDWEDNYEFDFAFPGVSHV